MFSQEQLEQLKVLINQSEVLSAQEREEWLGLLPFMNDKQLTSLAGLLKNNQNTTKKASQVQVSVVKPVRDSSVVTELPKPPEPPLDMKKSVESNGNVNSDPSTGANLSDFIKNNFSKDASSPTDYLKKQSGSDDRSNSLQVKTEQKQVIPTLLQEEKIAGDSKKTEKSTSSGAGLLQHEGAVRKIAQIGEEKQGQALPGAHVQGPLDLQDVKVLPVKEKEAVQDSPVKIGMDLPMAATLEQEQVTIESKTGLEKEKEEEFLFVAEPIIKLTSLEDVKKLNVATLRGSGVINISQKLHELSEKHGYFTVVFALETSPLYHAYLAMGIKALRDQKSFEEVEQEMDKKTRQYMTKPEFEAFSDMLRKIRSA